MPATCPYTQLIASLLLVSASPYRVMACNTPHRQDCVGTKLVCQGANTGLGNETGKFQNTEKIDT